MKIPPVYLVFIAAILAGVLNLFSKDLLNAGMGPMEICACREGITAAVFGLALLFFDRRAFRIRIRDVPLFLLFGAFNVVSNVCVFTAQESLPLEVAAVLEMTSPYFMLVLAFFLFGDRITRRKVLAAVLAFVGCIFIIGIVDSPGDMDVLGVAIGLLSGLTLAAFTIGSKYVGERGHTENSAMFYFFLFSALLVVPISDFGCISFVMASSPLIPVCVLTMGVMCTLLPNYIIVYAVRRVDPAAVSIIITSSLIVSTICGVLVFGDEFGASDVLGIVLVMVAITILEPPESVKRRFRRPEDSSRRLESLSHCRTWRVPWMPSLVLSRLSEIIARKTGCVPGSPGASASI